MKKFLVNLCLSMAFSLGLLASVAMADGGGGIEEVCPGGNGFACAITHPCSVPTSTCKPKLGTVPMYCIC